MFDCFDCKYKKGTTEEEKKYCWKCTDGSKFEEVGIVKEVEVKAMKKTFKEVIADIKEGEVWENKNYEIKCDCGNVRIYHKYVENCKIENAVLSLNCNDYELQRSKVSNTEAFKAYKKGEEIESCVTERIYDIRNKNQSLMAIEEVMGEWYINA